MGNLPAEQRVAQVSHDVCQSSIFDTNILHALTVAAVCHQMSSASEHMLTAASGQQQKNGKTAMEQASTRDSYPPPVYLAPTELGVEESRIVSTPRVQTLLLHLPI